ncbi:MAG: potassium channel protein [Gemmatimonadales bacterium]|jgi:voltage-gated potassium channel
MPQSSVPYRRIRRQLIRFGLSLAAIGVMGVTGYMVLEGWSVVEALYMTVITLSTVGFSEVRPLSEAGRFFTTALIVAGVGAVTYLFAAISQYIISGELTGSLRKSRMQNRIDALTGHYIICGYGRVGQQARLDLERKGKQCVVIEELESELPQEGTVLSVVGDAADDDVLARAGIDRAAGLVAATGEDATNLFVTLTARTLKPDIVIVARANQPASEHKLRRAGASHVISPYIISGRRIARQLLYPSVTDFLDVVMHSGSLELLLEECRVDPESDLHGTTVHEAQVRSRTGANVLAVRRHAEGNIVTNPPAEMRFEPGDVLIALGTETQLKALEGIAGSRG